MKRMRFGLCTHHVVGAGTMPTHGIVACPKRKVVVALVSLHHEIVDLLALPAGRPDEVTALVQDGHLRISRSLDIPARGQEGIEIALAAAVPQEEVRSWGDDRRRLERLDGVFSERLVVELGAVGEDGLFCAYTARQQ